MAIPASFSRTVVASLSARSNSDSSFVRNAASRSAKGTSSSSISFKEGGEGAGQEEIIDRHNNLTVARAIYRGRVSQYPGRLIMLCDRARVLARSDRA